jgi:hypothetical protein
LAFFRPLCTCLSLQPRRSPGCRRPSRAGSPSPDHRPGGTGLRLACCLQCWPSASATGEGLPMTRGNTGGARGGAVRGATGKVALYFLSSNSAHSQAGNAPNSTLTPWSSSARASSPTWSCLGLGHAHRYDVACIAVDCSLRVAVVIMGFLLHGAQVSGYGKKAYQQWPAYGINQQAQYLSSDGAGQPQMLQYSPLRAEKHSTFALAGRPCRAERTAWQAVRMQLS